jgi:hypothetical protein
MIRQSRIAVNFNKPVVGKDLLDSTQYSSTKHWVMAELLVYSQASARFIDADGNIVGEWPSDVITGVFIPVLDEDSPVILEQKSHDYQAVVKQQRPSSWSHWTRTEEQLLLQNAEKGYSYEELADIHLRTPVAIFERLLRLGFRTEDYPKLGTRPQKRHYRPLGLWEGKAPEDGSEVTVCLGCGYEIASLPCKCWSAKDTTGTVVYRDHRLIRTIYGTVIGKRY